jgi:ribonuclease HI
MRREPSYGFSIFARRRHKLDCELEAQRLANSRAQRHEVEWFWVKGHADDELNDRADRLAREGMARYLG